MSHICSAMEYWLVNHPTIQNFTWTPGKTMASTPQFLCFSILSYLSSIFILLPQMKSLPSIPPSILKPISAVHNTSLLLLSLIMALGCLISTISQAPHLHWIVCSTHQAHRAHILLGLHLLPLQDPRVHGHRPHHPQQLQPTALVPPRVPPLQLRDHVLHLAANLPDAVPRGALHQRLRARANVRLLLIVRTWGAPKVEEACDQHSDHAVLLELRGSGAHAVLPLHRFRVLRGVGLVLQCHFLCLSFGPVRGLSQKELWCVVEEDGCQQR